MRRDLSRLDGEELDLLIIGGGIHGACVAWDATLRGLTAGLIEQRDFASGTTGNSLRIAHGGLRAIQQFAVGRLRQSTREQAILFRIAAGFVQPLPCLIPIYRGASAGRAAFKAAFASSRVLTADIQRSYDLPLPGPRVISAEETRACFDGFDGATLEGGALWYDAQVPDLERLVLAFLRSAAERGAAIANYVRARRLVVQGGSVVGVDATDQHNGRNFRIRARSIVNAAGPWCNELGGPTQAESTALPRRWAQGVNLVLDRPPPPVALGIRSPWGAERDPVMGGHRYLFLTGWKGMTLAGTSYRYDGRDRSSVPVQVRELVEEWNDACPSLGWKVSEVSHHHCGRLPLREGFQPGRPTDLLGHGAVVDHAGQGQAGLVSIVGTKFTTARSMAELAVDSVFHSLGRAAVQCTTAAVPLSGDSPARADLSSAVRRAVEDEMASTLEDIVVRRLGLGLVRCPSVNQLAEVADAAAPLLGWNRRQVDEEIGQLLGRFHPSGVTRAA
jgi:glycerol-3-phosphate dehydrogenase